MPNYMHFIALAMQKCSFRRPFCLVSYIYHKMPLLYLASYINIYQMQANKLLNSMNKNTNYAILRTATIRYRYRKYNAYNSAVPEYQAETFETKKRNTTSFTILKIINKVFTLISANETPTCRIIALLINNILLEVYTFYRDNYIDVEYRY